MLSGKEGVDTVSDQRQIFEPVFAVLNRATIATAALAAVMVVVAIMLTGTTIRMSAASRKTRNGNHAFGGCFELDDSIAVHSGRCDRVVGGFAAVLRHAFGIGEGVRH